MFDQLKFSVNKLLMRCIVGNIFGYCSIFLMGCNVDPQITPQSQLSIYPASKSIDIQEYRNELGQCVYIEDHFQDIPVKINIVNAEGFPISGALVSVYLEFSGNTFSGPPAMELFYDRNGNGVADTTDERVSDFDDEIFRVKTSQNNGDVNVLVRANLSCGFKGVLYAFSGPLSASMQVQINSSVSP